MDVAHSGKALPDFLLDDEIAAYLRKAKSTAVRMRLHGGLPYIPGRPPLVAKADLLAYLEQKKRAKAGPPPKKPFAEMTQGEQVAEARARAMRMKLKPIRRPRPKS